MPLRHLFHNFHSQHIGVYGNVGCAEYGRHFVLGGRNLVVLGLGKHAVGPQLVVQIAHKLNYAGFKHAVVMVFKFLPAGYGRAEKRSAAQAQVLSPHILLFVHKEVLLFGTDRSVNLFALSAEQRQNALCLFVYGVHRAQQRRFFIESFTRVGYEYGGYVQRTLLYERGRSGVPRGVTARHIGNAGAARRKAGSVCLAYG